MNKIKFILLSTIYESRNHKSLLLSFLAATFFIWILGFHVDLVWEGGKIIQSQNSIWFEGESEDYGLGFVFAYHSILLITIFYSTGVLYQNLKPGSLSLLLVKPISRKAIISYQILSSTILVWCVFVYINLSLWLCLGIRYGTWLSGLWSSLGIIFVICLVLNCLALFFSLIVKRAASSAFLCLFFIMLIPIFIPLLERNFNFSQGTENILVSALEILSPKLLKNFSETSEIILDAPSDFSSLPQTLIFGAVTYIGSLSIFDRKSV